MFVFRVLTWNSGYNESRYLKSINRILFGGTSGHASAELVIPVTDENRQLIQAVNQNQKLLVEETTTLVHEVIETPPFYQKRELPCFKIYFSFWGDVSTQTTPERHRMLDFFRDCIIEGQGLPLENTALGQKVLGDKETEWNGLIGSIKGSPAIETIQHLANLSEEDVRHSKQKMKLLESIKQDKEKLLWDVKQISAHLAHLKTEEEKQAYKKSAEFLEILEKYALDSFEELKLNLASKSAAITQLYKDISDLGVQFGSPPDSIVYFPLMQEQDLSLDYKPMLQEMGRIANGKVPYHALKMNCSTVVMKIIKAGINLELREKLVNTGISLPKSNILFETPQSVYDFAFRLYQILSKSEPAYQGPRLGLIARFSLMMNQLYHWLLALIYKPSQKQLRLNLREEYYDYLLKTKAGLSQLEKEFETGRISLTSYQQLKENANQLIQFYQDQLLSLEQDLLAKGYTKTTGDYPAQIKYFLETLPYAQEQAISELDSDSEITETIDKITAHIFSNLKWKEIYGQIKLEEISKVVSLHVQAIVNRQRLKCKEYDFESAKKTKNIEFLLAKMTKILETPLNEQKTWVDRDLASIFLRQYETRLKLFKAKVLVYQKKLIQPGVDVPKTLELLSAVQTSILEFEAAIDKIKNGSETSIEILFPPISQINLMSSTQIQSYFDLLSTKIKSNSSIQVGKFELDKNIRLYYFLKEKINRLAYEINPTYFDFNIISKVASRFGRGVYLHQITDSMLAVIAQNICDNLKQHTLQRPLTEDAKDWVIAYLNLVDFVQYNPEMISDLAKINAILSEHDSKKLKLILVEHLRNGYLLQAQHQNPHPSSISPQLQFKEHRSIYLLNQINQNKIGGSGSIQEKIELSIILENMIGDMGLNKRLNLFEKEKHPFVKNHQSSIRTLKDFTFKTKLAHLNDYLLEKSISILQAIEKDRTISNQRKLTLFELGRLGDLVNMRNVFLEFESMGVIEHSPKLKKLYTQVIKAAEIMDKINLEIKAESIFKSGDLVMNYSKKFMTLKNKSFDKEPFLTQTFVSKYSHAAQVFIDPENNEAKMSHIWGTYQDDKINCLDIAISDIFRMDVTRLISPEMKKKLKVYYLAHDMDYHKEIQTLFECSMQKLVLGSQERFLAIKNDRWKRFKAGMASFGLYGGDKDKSMRFRNSVHRIMYGQGNYPLKNKMICSEFVASSLIAALIETNQILRQQMLDAKVVRPSETILNIPLKNKRLSRTHPQALIDLLKAENCLVEVKTSDFLQKIVDQESIKQKIEIKKPEIELFENLCYLAKNTDNQQDFVSLAMDRCQAYGKQEAIDVDLSSLAMQNLLTKAFSSIHLKMRENVNVLVRLLRKLMHVFGFKSQVEEKIWMTILGLEKSQAEFRTSNKTAMFSFFETSTQQKQAEEVGLEDKSKLSPRK